MVEDWSCSASWPRTRRSCARPPTRNRYAVSHQPRSNGARRLAVPNTAAPMTNTALLADAAPWARSWSRACRAERMPRLVSRARAGGRRAVARSNARVELWRRRDTTPGNAPRELTPRAISRPGTASAMAASSASLSARSRLVKPASHAVSHRAAADRSAPVARARVGRATRLCAPSPRTRLAAHAAPPRGIRAPRARRGRRVDLRRAGGWRRPPPRDRSRGRRARCREAAWRATRRPRGAWPGGWPALGSSAMRCSLQTRRILTPSCSPAPCGWSAGRLRYAVTTSWRPRRERSEPVGMSEDQSFVPARSEPDARSRDSRGRRGRRGRDTARAARPRRRASLDDGRRTPAHVHLQRHGGRPGVLAGAPASGRARRDRGRGRSATAWPRSIPTLAASAAPAERSWTTTTSCSPSARRRARLGATASRFGEDPAEEALHGLLEEVERGYVGQVAFVVPGCGTVWPLPLYELAIMAARQAWSMGMDQVRFALVTPEERPLGVFGRAPSQAIGGAARRLRHRVHRLDLCDGRPLLRAARPLRAAAGRRARRELAGAGGPGPAGRARGSLGLHPRRPARSSARPRRRLRGR